MFGHIKLVKPATLIIEIPVSSQEKERSCICDMSQRGIDFDCFHDFDTVLTLFILFFLSSLRNLTEITVFK
jgi:hypothetical protein